MEEPLSYSPLQKLPDDVIEYILRFLPTRDAVATSILSRWWLNFYDRFIYTHIDLNPSLHEGDQNGEFVGKETAAIDFMLFSWKLLAKCGRGWPGRMNLHFPKFYDLDEEEYDYQLDDLGLKWALDVVLNSAISLDVSDIRITSDDGAFTLIPYEVLAGLKQWRVRVLSMENTGCLSFSLTLFYPTMHMFPNLTRLQLHQADLINDHSLHRLMKGCPSLQVFDIEINTVEEMDIIYLWNPSVRDLTFKLNEKQKIPVVVRPKLSSFKYCGNGIHPITVNSSNLEHLSIIIDEGSHIPKVGSLSLPEDMDVDGDNMKAAGPIVEPCMFKNEIKFCFLSIHVCPGLREQKIECGFEASLLLHHLNTVESLVLSPAVLEVLANWLHASRASAQPLPNHTGFHASAQPLPIFTSLKELVIEVGTVSRGNSCCVAWIGLKALIESAPKLEKLLLKQVFWDEPFNRMKGNVFETLLPLRDKISSIQQIHMVIPYSPPYVNAYAREFVAHFARNGRSLQKIVIRSSLGDSNQILRQIAEINGTLTSSTKDCHDGKYWKTVINF